MKRGKSVRHDVRRSMSLLLALLLIFGAAMPIGVNAAAEDVVLKDQNKAIGIFLKEYEEGKNCVGITSKLILEEGIDPDSIDGSKWGTVQNPLCAEVFLTDDRGNEKTVFSYRTDYRSSYETAMFWMQPVFYNDSGDEIWSGDHDQTETECEDAVWGYYLKQERHEGDKGLYGLHPDFIDYVREKFGEDVDAGEVFAFLTSSGLRGGLSIRLSWKENGAPAEKVVSGYSVIDCGGSRAQTYGAGFGYCLDYSRIEDMSAYRGSDDYSKLKLYRGDIYVDADKIAESETVLTLPDYNRTGLAQRNSLSVNGQGAWDDGSGQITVTDRYNIVGGAYSPAAIFPDGALNSLEEAMEYCLEMYQHWIAYSNKNADPKDVFFDYIGQYGYSKSDYPDYDFDDDYAYTPASFYHSIVATDKTFWAPYGGRGYRMTYNYSDSSLTLKGYEIDDVVEMWDPAKDGYGNGDAYKGTRLDSLVLPEISLENLSKEDADKYYRYLDGLQSLIRWGINGADGRTINPFESGIDINSESVYSGVFSDSGVSRDFTCQNVITILSNIAWDNSPGEGLEDSTGLDTLIGFTPKVPEGYTLVECYYNGSDATWVGLASELQIPSGLKGYCKLVEEYGGAEAMIAYLDGNQELSKSFQNCMFAAEMIQHERRAVSGAAAAAEQSDAAAIVEQSDTALYAGIEVPLSAFDRTLGKENVIKSYYYVPGIGTVFLWRLTDAQGEGTGTMLYHGEYRPYDYKMYSFMASDGRFIPNDIEMLDKILQYSEAEALFGDEFATVIFAKVPEPVTAREEYTTGERELELTWGEPADNGAEIIGYQVAVVPKGAEVTETDFMALATGSYQDLGDSYEIRYATKEQSYTVSVGTASKDVYVRAVNVIGPGSYEKITVNSLLELKLTGPDEVRAGSSEADYDTVDTAGVNVEADVTYSLQGNPDKVSITSEGKLIVDKDCGLSSVVVISTGNAGTKYEGITLQKEVRIVAAGDGTEPKPEPPAGDGTEPKPEPPAGDGTVPKPEPPAGDGAAPKPDTAVSALKTGDESRLTEMLILELAAAAVLTGVGMRYKRRRRMSRTEL